LERAIFRHNFAVSKGTNDIPEDRKKANKYIINNNFKKLQL